LGRLSVGTYLRRARDAGLSWSLPEGLDDDGLEFFLLPASPTVPDPDRPVPDWSMIDKSQHSFFFSRQTHTISVSGIALRA
jgi:hypothetical protein